MSNAPFGGQLTFGSSETTNKEKQKMRELLKAISYIGVSDYYNVVDLIIQEQHEEGIHDYDAALAEAVKRINADPHRYIEDYA
jgi:hypothetical protein